MTRFIVNAPSDDLQSRETMLRNLDRALELAEKFRNEPKCKRGRPRLEDAKNTLAATKPWAKLGMSERTWYRRQKEKR